MIKLATSDPHAQGRLLFCLIGRVVDARVDARVGHEIITLTYADGRTAEFATSGVAFSFDVQPVERGAESGERQDDNGNTMTDYPEPSSADR